MAACCLGQWGVQGLPGSLLRGCLPSSISCSVCADTALCTCSCPEVTSLPLSSTGLQAACLTGTTGALSPPAPVWSDRGQ